MAFELKYDLANNQLHADVVLGKNKSFPRGIAINMLMSSNVPNSADLLRKVLEKDADEPQFRRLAAVGLWRMNTPEAHRSLLNAAETVKDPVTLTAVVKCLGRIGDQGALQAILAVRKNAQGVLAAQATFAASLISYRLGLEGNDLPVPIGYVELPPSPRQWLKFFAPLKVEVNLFNSCLAHEPYGIELSKETLLQCNCPGRHWMVGFNSGIKEANTIELLKRRKTFMGIVAAKHSEHGRYSASYVILTSPDANGGKANIFINRITGEPAWAGSTTSITVEQARFTIRTVGWLGTVPMELEGIIMANGEVRITNATSTTRISEKRQPLLL